VDKEAKIEPPIHTEYFLSGGAIILILIVDGARAVISFCILSAIPGYIVVPVNTQEEEEEEEEEEKEKVVSIYRDTKSI